MPPQLWLMVATQEQTWQPPLNSQPAIREQRPRQPLDSTTTPPRRPCWFLDTPTRLWWCPLMQRPHCTTSIISSRYVLVSCILIVSRLTSDRLEFRVPLGLIDICVKILFCNFIFLECQQMRLWKVKQFTKPSSYTRKKTDKLKKWHSIIKWEKIYSLGKFVKFKIFFVPGFNGSDDYTTCDGFDPLLVPNLNRPIRKRDLLSNQITPFKTDTGRPTLYGNGRLPNTNGAKSI